MAAATSAEDPPLLVGRDRERSVLRRQLYVALTGSPDVVVVTGRAGIGKSALAASLRADVRRVDGWMAEGRFRRGPGSPYESVLDALAGVLRELLSEGVADARHWGPITDALDSSPAVRSALVSRAPALAERLGEALPITPDEDTAAARASLAFRRLVRTLAGLRQPLVLLLDDLQWADPPALALVAQLALAPIDGLLLVATRRGERVLDPRVRTTELALGPLSAADVARVIAGLGRRDLDGCWPLAGLLIEQGGGTPLQVRWLLDELLEAGLIEDGPRAGRGTSRTSRLPAIGRPRRSFPPAWTGCRTEPAPSSMSWPSEARAWTRPACCVWPVTCQPTRSPRPSRSG